MEALEASVEQGARRAGRPRKRAPRRSSRPDAWRPARRRPRRRPKKKGAARRRRREEEGRRQEEGDPARRLEKYRSMRDFDVTRSRRGQRSRRCRPGQPLRGAAPPGPSACTTTCASRSTASWPAGPCPRDPPSTRRHAGMAVHVEDHPLDYFDFEGVIPSGEYGGGDVIVWDWGTWSSAKDGQDDPVAGGRGRRAPLRPPRREAAGRFVLVRTRQAAATSSGCCSTSTTTTQSPAGTRATTRVGEVRPHQRRGEGGAAGHVDRTQITGGPRPPMPSSPRWTRWASRGSGDFQGRTLKLTNLDKVLFPGRRR